MKSLLFCVVTLALSIQAFSADWTIAIADRSSIGSPVKNSGTVTISTRVSNGSLYLSRQDDWKAQNTSQQPIVAMVEKLTVYLPNGKTMMRVAQYEAFFHPTLLQPSEEADLFAPAAGEEVSRFEEQSFDPYCEAELLWVQFADGTTFGDGKYAADFLRERKETWVALSRLNAVYKSKGAGAFLQELQKPRESATADGYIQHIRNFQHQHGTDAAAQRLEMHLKIAEQRAASAASLVQ
jgi:hypothetical protein